MLKLIGVKETNEEVELPLDKEFNIKLFDYTVVVENDIKTIKIEKEAYEYNDLVQILGLEDELKVGENHITLKLSKDEKEISYHINIIKEKPKQKEIEQVSAEIVEEKQKEPIMVCISLLWFIGLEIVIIGVSVGVTIGVMNYIKKHKLEDENRKQERIPRRKRTK